MTSEAKQRIINDMLALDKYTISAIAKAAHVSNRDVKFVKLPPITKITRDGNNGNIKPKIPRETTWTFTFNKVEMLFFRFMMDSFQSQYKIKSPLRCEICQAQREKMGVDRIG